MSYIAKILGTDYDVTLCPRENDVILKECNGYCDPSIKKIAVVDLKVDAANDHMTLKNLSVPQSKIFRHEYIHAMLFESGLHDYYEDELLVDWIALQFPKMMKLFTEMGVEK